MMPITGPTPIPTHGTARAWHGAREIHGAWADRVSGYTVGLQDCGGGTPPTAWRMHCTCVVSAKSSLWHIRTDD
jgi:hypothetical protein